MCWFQCSVNCLIMCLLNLLAYFLTYQSTSSRIGPFHFEAGGCRRWPKPGFSFLVRFMLWYILLQMHVCFCCVCFSFSVLSQEIGWEERLRNDLFLCQVGHKTLTQSITDLVICHIQRTSEYFRLSIIQLNTNWSYDLMVGKKCISYYFCNFSFGFIVILLLLFTHLPLGIKSV